MNKLKIKGKISENMAEVYDTLFSSSQTKKLIQELQLSDKFIQENYTLLLYFSEQNACCEHCHGIKDCLKQNRGMKYQLQLKNQELVESFAYCSYFADYYQMEENLLYTSYKKEDILLPKKNFIKEHVNDLKNYPFLASFLIQCAQNQPKGFYFYCEDAKYRKNIFCSLLENQLLKKYRCCIIKTSSFLRDLKDSFKDKEHYDLILNQVFNADVLILDDFGGEVISSWSRDEILTMILSYRLDKDLLCIFGSDYPLHQLPLLYVLNNDKMKADKFIRKIEQCIQNR